MRRSACGGTRHRFCARRRHRPDNDDAGTALAAPRPRTRRRSTLPAGSSVGRPVTLHGTFPDAPKARVAIRHQRPAPATRSRRPRDDRRRRPLPDARAAAPKRPLARRARLAAGADRCAERAIDTHRHRADRRALEDQGDGTDAIERRRDRAGRRQGDARRRPPQGRRPIGGHEETTRAGSDGRFGVAWKARSTGTYPCASAPAPTARRRAPATAPAG